MTHKQFLMTLVRGVAILLAVYVPTFVLVSAFIMLRANPVDDGSASVGAAIPLVISISLVIAILLIAALGDRQFQSFGFMTIGTKALVMSIGIGLGFGLVLRYLSAILNVPQTEFPGLAFWQLIAFFWIAAPVQEEIIFRGLLQNTLQNGIPSLISIGSRKLSVAALISAIAFALVHFALLGIGATPGTIVFVIFGALALGVAAGQMRWITGSLLPGIVMHSLINIIGSIS